MSNVEGNISELAPPLSKRFSVFLFHPFQSKFFVEFVKKFFSCGKLVTLVIVAKVANVVVVVGVVGVVVGVVVVVVGVGVDRSTIKQSFRPPKKSRKQLNKRWT